MNLWLRRAALIVLLVSLSACVVQPPRPASTVDSIARRYVQMELRLNHLHPGELIDDQASASLHNAAVQSSMSVLDISRQAQQAIIDLHTLPPDAQMPRRIALENQLASLTARAGILRGWKPTFDDEIRALYDVQPLTYDTLDVDASLKQLDSLLPQAPGASLAERYAAYLRQYTVSGTQLKSAVQTVLSAARVRTAAHLQLPANEHLELILSDDGDASPGWELREHYLGHGRSRLQLNTAITITLARVVEWVAREAYPGRHAGDTLRQQALLEGHGWIEYSVLPRYSPQAFIAEGRAAAGINLVFPQRERVELEQQLFRQAGYDPQQAAAYDLIWQLGQQLQPVIYLAAREFCEGRQSAAQTQVTLQLRALMVPAQAADWIARFKTRRGASVIGILAQSVITDSLSRSAQTLSDSAPVRVRVWKAYARLSMVPLTPYQLQQQSAARQ